MLDKTRLIFKEEEIMKISELIIKLQKLKSEHGDLEVYETTDCDVIKYDTEFRPKAVKLYHQKWEDADYMKDCLSDGNLDESDAELHDVDVKRPIIKAIII